MDKDDSIRIKEEPIECCDCFLKGKCEWWDEQERPWGCGEPHYAFVVDEEDA